MTTPEADTTIPLELSLALTELGASIEFFDRVKGAPEAEKTAVGTDHWNWLEKAARRASALYDALQDGAAAIAPVSADPAGVAELAELSRKAIGTDVTFGQRMGGACVLEAQVAGMLISARIEPLTLRSGDDRHVPFGRLLEKLVNAYRSGQLVPAAQPSAAGQPVRVTYTNWRDETAEREITPTGRVLFTSNEWHPEPQWLVEAYDARSGDVRLFALTGFGAHDEGLDGHTTLKDDGRLLRAWMKEAGCTPSMMQADRDIWRTRAEAALAAVQDDAARDGQDVSGPGAVAAGWRLVPVEPTEEMLGAHLGLSPHRLPAEMYESRRDLRPVIYKAMLAAAPTPPATALGVNEEALEVARQWESWYEGIVSDFVGVTDRPNDPDRLHDWAWIDAHRQPPEKYSPAEPWSAAAPGKAADPNSWEANVRHLLAQCPYTIRCCEGGGPEDLKGSLALTFTNMQGLLGKTSGGSVGPYQARVAAWQDRIIFDDPTDLAERTHRFTEEANELARALGQTREEAHQLVDYVHDQGHVGEPFAEIGGTVLTLAALCVVGSFDMMASAEADLARVSTPEMVAKIREKRSKRHGRGPLPGTYAPDFIPVQQANPEKPGQEGDGSTRVLRDPPYEDRAERYSGLTPSERAPAPQHDGEPEVGA